MSWRNWLSTKKRNLSRNRRSARRTRVQQLEDRLVLNADFAYSAGNLVLDNFEETVAQDLTIYEDANYLYFSLAEGVWSGNDGNTAFQFGNGSYLAVWKPSLIGRISIRDTLDVDFDSHISNTSFGSANVLELNGINEVTTSSDFSIPNLEVNVFSLDLHNRVVDIDSINGHVIGTARIIEADEIQIANLVTGDLTVIADGSVSVSGSVQSWGRADIYASEGISIADAMFDAQTHIFLSADGGVSIANSDIGSRFGKIDVTGYDYGIPASVEIVTSNLTAGQGHGIEIEGFATSPESMHGVRLEASALNSSDGDISVIGIGRGGATANEGLRIVSGSRIETGTGDISLFGQSAVESSQGFRISNSSILRTTSGNIQIVGESLSDAGHSNFGGIIEGGSSITSTAAGDISISGTGGNSGADNYGLLVTSGANIRTDGEIVLTGRGGDGTDRNYGVVLRGGAFLEAVGTGSIRIDGTGGDGTHRNNGVQITEPNTAVVAADGNILVTGNGAGTGDGGFGVELTSDSRIETTGAGSISIDGSAANSHGVVVHAPARTIASGSGAIQIQGSGTNRSGLSFSGEVHTNTGAATLESADDITFGTTARVVSASGRVSITADTADGNNGGEFDMKNGSVIDAGSGSITVHADGGISIARLVTTGPIQVTSTGSAITDSGDTGGADLEGSTLLINAATLGAGQQSNPLETQVSRIESATGPNGLFVNNTGDIEVGGIGPQDGIDSSGPIHLNAASTISVSEPITTTARDVLLSATDNIWLTSAESDISTNGAGVASFTAGRQIAIEAGASITVEDGNMTLSANAGNRAGDFSGFKMHGGSLAAFGAGDIIVSANGGNDPGSGNHFGIEIRHRSIIASSASLLASVHGGGSASIDLNGRAGTGSSDSFGVLIDLGSEVTSNFGGISIVGVGANNSFGNTGVSIGARIASNATGGFARGISINGTGGTGPGSFNRGVQLDAAEITSVDGSISVVGHGGGSANSNHGVWIQDASRIESTGTGNVQFNGTATGNDGHGFGSTASSTIAAADGLLSVTGTGASASDVAILGSLISGAGNVHVSAPFEISFDKTAEVRSTSGRIDVLASTAGDNNGKITLPDGAEVVGGSSTVNFEADGDIRLGRIQTTGAVTITSRHGSVVDFGDTNGSDVEAASLVLDVPHGGVGLSTNSLETQVAQLEAVVGTNKALFLANTGDLEIGGISSVSGVSSGAGTISITAASTITVSEPIDAHGGHIVLDATEDILFPASDSVLRTTGLGAIDVTAARRIQFSANSSARVEDGNLTINANLDASSPGNFIGLVVSGALLETTGAGNISLTASGGIEAITQGNVGIRIEDSATIRSTATAGGMVTITGSGVGGSSDNVGVRIANSQITSVDGDVEISGSSTNVTGDSNFGIIVEANSVIESTGTGSVAAALTLNGSGGEGTNDNHGVLITSGGVLETVHGDIIVNGTSGSGAGVRTVAQAQIRATGSGSVLLNGTGSGRPAVELHSAPISSIDSQSGDLSILATGDIDVSGPGISSSSGLVLLNGDANVTVADGTEIDAGTGAIRIAANSNIRPGRVLADGAVITSASGSIFDSGDTGGADIQAASLVVSAAAGGVGAVADALELDVSQLEGMTGASDFVVTNSGNLTIGGISLIPGLSSAGGTLDVSTTGSAVISEPVMSAGGDIQFSATQSIQFSGSASEVSTTGEGTVTVDALKNILMQSGSSISVEDGSLTMNGNASGTETSLETGIELDDASLSTGNGDITLTGQGGVIATSRSSGIYIRNGSDIYSTGTGPAVGAISLNGTSGTFESADGVEIASSSVVSSIDGDINVQGTAVSSADEGIFLVNSATIRTTGDGNITLQGSGGESGYGSRRSNGVLIMSLIESDSGTVEITGHAKNANFDDDGVEIFNSGAVRSNSGAIIINGTSVAGAGIKVAGATVGTATGIGALVLEADTVSFIETPVIQGSGTLQIQPSSSDTTIGIGTGSGTLQLDSTAMSALADGFSGITIGRNDGIGHIEVVTQSFNDPISIIGGTIEVSALDSGTEPATLEARTGNIGVANGMAGVDISASDLVLIVSGPSGDLGTPSDPLRIQTDTLTTDTAASNGKQYLSAHSTVWNSSAAGSGTIHLESGTFETAPTAEIVGSVAVRTGAVLGGSGRIEGTLIVTSTGTVAPGNSPGTLRANTVHFESGSDLHVELNGPVPGDDYDQLVADGPVNLNTDSGTGATLSIAGAIPAAGDVFMIVNNTSSEPVVGTFDGFADGTIFEFNGVTTRIDYRGGDGNDVTLDVVTLARSFVRQNPPAQQTSADTLVIRTTFSNDVFNLDPADFVITGGTTASISHVNAMDGRTYDLTISGGDLASFNGTVGLDLAPLQDLVDVAGRPILHEEPSVDESWLVSNAGIFLVDRQLRILGTDLADSIIIDDSTTSVRVRANGTVWPTTTFDASLIDSILVLGRAGNDRVHLSGHSLIPTEIHGGEGDDNLRAGNADDLIFGGLGNDTLVGGGGHDVLTDVEGDNRLHVSEGNNRLTTGPGDDTIRAGGGRDTIAAGSGSNQIIDVGGDNQITAGDGPDIIRVGSGNDLVDAGDGSNSIHSRGGDSTISAGSGDDRISAVVGNNTIAAGHGNNAVRTGPGNDSISAGNGEDTVTDSGGHNLVSVGDGSDRIRTGFGSDTILGGAGDNYVYSRGGQNHITALAGDNRITTGPGDDLISTGSGNNVVSVGNGDNEVSTGDGRDTIRSGTGADLIRAGNGDNTIHNRGGASTISAGTGNDRIYATAGDNSISAGSGNNTVHTGIGNDTISAAGGVNVVTDTGGDNFVNVGSGSDRIRTGLGNDTILGGAGDNLIQSGGGQNMISVLDGNNRITTGAGNDNVEAGDGNNRIRAGAGHNTILSGFGDDIISTGDGNDSIEAGEGNNTVSAGDGNNFVTTGDGADSIRAGIGQDTVLAGNGENRIRVLAGDNRIESGTGHDLVSTGTGADVILAGNGNNRVYAGAGANSIATGSGHDTVVAHHGADTIFVGAGDNTVSAGDGDNDVMSGAGRDIIRTGTGNDTVDAGDGNNVVMNRAGISVIVTGGGDDNIRNLGGQVTISAGDGDNLVNAVGGDNHISTGSGSDRIRTQTGNDTILSGDGDDVVYTAGGDNMIESGNGADVVTTRDGTSRIWSGTGADYVRVGGSHNVVVAGGGDDRVIGSIGKDLLIGGAGRDTLFGNSDDDLIVAGFSLLDNNFTALRLVIREWSSNREYSARVDNIRHGTGDILQGAARLQSTGTARNVFDDNAVDQLFGRQGNDWFFVDNDRADGDDDLPRDRTVTEFVDSLDSAG